MQLAETSMISITCVPKYHISQHLTKLHSLDRLFGVVVPGAEGKIGMACILGAR